MTIEDIIKDEYKKLSDSINESEKSNVLYNIIMLKVKLSQTDGLYKDIKQFSDSYIETIKMADYGYDNYNYSKIEQLIQYLPSNEQISILQYITSVSARELPEHDRTWFVTRIHQSEIKQIFESKNYIQYPKTVFLYLGQSVVRLLLGLTVLFIITCLILLPASIDSFAIFEVSYEIYSQNSMLNHIMNVLALFADLNNNLKVEPIGLFGLLVIIIGKLLFITFIINFFYYKISDKISQK
jgi:hypothetical protein